MGLTVQVQFPDGVRSVPAYVQVPWLDRGDSFASHFDCDMSVVTPYDIDGWEFQRLIGYPEWCAFQVPTRAQNRHYI